MTELRAALAEKGPDYVPRTHHLLPDGAPKYINRLIFEDSPYLLQHAHNPVDWYPWGDEAFERARSEHKPIFLSVGYSTCHWCHVMERESFEDEEIAAYLNEHFIAVKVDREARPDVDDVYMQAVQMMTGRGGWPMTVVMTPQGDPFFGGTYFPPRDGVRAGRPGLMRVLQTLAERYAEDPSALITHAREVSQQIEAQAAPTSGGDVPDLSPVTQLVEQAAARHDHTYGGFGRAPKFPRPALPDLLLRHHYRTGDAGALSMVDRTLSHMVGGGIYDQIGGGFHRYSTDDRWLVPHFEKMLYDNAQLVVLLLHAHQRTGRKDYARVAGETLAYVDRELSDARGAFFSATDADSPTPDGHQEEGYFFSWTPAEFAAVLDAPVARTAAAFFGVEDGGNFEGRSILTRRRSAAEVGAQLGLSPAEVAQHVAQATRRLYAARAKRPPSHCDDKVLTAWNGLMISAFAQAGVILGDARWTERGRRAADFLLSEMRDAEGRLLRVYRAGRPQQLGYLDDHAFLIAGLLDLFEATADLAYLEAAIALQAALDAHFRDEAGGGYYASADYHERLLARQQPSYDGAEPSGNGVAAMNLLRLADLLDEDAYRSRATQLLAAFSAELTDRPLAVPGMLAALQRHHGRSLEVFVLAPDGGADRDGLEALWAVVARTYLPHRWLLRVSSSETLQALQTRVPALRGKQPLDGRATAFVCEEGRCQLPTHDPETLAEQLAAARPQR